MGSSFYAFKCIVSCLNFDLSGGRCVPPAASFLGKKLGKNLSGKGYEQPYSPFKEIKWLHFSLFRKVFEVLRNFFPKSF